MNVRHFFVCAFSMIFLFGSSGIAQVAACGDFDKKITYKILDENITTKESRRHLFMDVFIKPDRFTVDSMIQLAKRFRVEYCQFDSLAVFFFDTTKRDRINGPAPQPLIDYVPKIASRGMYIFDRQANSAELTFQGKRNNKLIDVEIMFTADGYCVTETLDQPNGNE